ncbi:hypothetical protein [Methylosoma difficile]
MLFGDARQLSKQKWRIGLIPSAIFLSSHFDVYRGLDTHEVLTNPNRHDRGGDGDDAHIPMKAGLGKCKGWVGRWGGSSPPAAHKPVYKPDAVKHRLRSLLKNC